MSSSQHLPGPRLIGRLQVAAAGFLALALLVGLVAFAYAGSFSRYWADDYCYSATIKQLGLLRGVVDWYNTSGNRLSTLFVVALSELFGPRAIRFIPAALLVLWAAAWMVFLRALTDQRLRRLPGGLWIAVLALLQVYFTVLLAPDRLQTLYWRMGSLHYSLPVPLLLLNLALLLRAVKNDRPWFWTAFFSAVLAFFTAGLSETFAALQAALLAGLIGAALVFRQASAWRRRSAAWLLVFPLAGTLAMMLIMASAPANAWRQDALPPPDNLLDVLPYSLRYAWDFIYYSLRGAPLPFLVFFAAVFAIGLAARGLFVPPGGRVSTAIALLGALACLLAAYLLVATSFAPSAYAGLAYPAGRAQMPGHAALLAGLSGAALFLAALGSAAPGNPGWASAESASAASASATFAARLLQDRPVWVGAAAAVLLLASALYPIRALSIPRADAGQLSIRAARWDARAAQILAARAPGAGLQVRQVDVVQGLEDIGPDPDFWINRCAAVYFEVGRLIALP